VELGDRHIVLIGMMGAGKTTVGRLLAGKLGREFWDNDEALIRDTGLDAAQVEQRRGEDALHQLEDRLLHDALQRPEPMVLAAAGSVVLAPSVLEGARTVWLRLSVSVEQAHITASGQHHRPLPAGALTTLERLTAERASLYARIADVQVDVADGPEATCERVLEALAERRGHKHR
jgi:shikimate kinase